MQRSSILRLMRRLRISISAQSSRLRAGNHRRWEKEPIQCRDALSDGGRDRSGGLPGCTAGRREQKTSPFGPRRDGRGTDRFCLFSRDVSETGAAELRKFQVPVPVLDQREANSS